MTPIFGICGFSGSGKTFLICRLIKHFSHKGLRVATLKHAHHSFDVDTKGKDSHSHRMAGATEVLVASEKRWALMHEHKQTEQDQPWQLPQLLAKLSPADLVLVEGFKTEPIPKLEVYRQANPKQPTSNHPQLWRTDPHIKAVASDEPIPDCAIPNFNLNQIDAIADFIYSHPKASKPSKTP